MLNKRTSVTSKLVLLFSLLMVGTGHAALVSTDRFLLKIVDKIISYQDVEYQLRNLKALQCVYPDAFVVTYFSPKFLKELDSFMKNFPKEDDAVSKYLHSNESILLKVRHFFKMLRYSEDQRTQVSPELSKLIREGAKENKCNTDVLYKDTLKTNFISLLEMEIYLRNRYGTQAKTGAPAFDTIRPSVDLFVESLDKQFSHEYYW